MDTPPLPAEEPVPSSPSSPQIPATRGRVRPPGPVAKAHRERMIVEALRRLPANALGVTVDTLAADVLGMSRWQASVIVALLVEVNVLRGTPSRMTGPKGGRPPTLYNLEPAYRARLDAEDAMDAALGFGRATAVPRRAASVAACVVSRRVMQPVQDGRGR